MNLEKQYLKVQLTLPNEQPAEGATVLLHACCAPCSAAIIECMLRNGMKPTVFFSNSNIYPQEEYNIRRREIIRFLEEQNVPYIEDDYNHEEWLQMAQNLANEPERGKRCSICFEYRLARAAAYAELHHISLITTTLASSRWKNIEQINEAGRRAVTPYSVTFWEQNWRKGGLQDRRNQLLNINQFYNQQYCGCEYSMQRLQNKAQ